MIRTTLLPLVVAAGVLLPACGGEATDTPGAGAPPAHTPEFDFAPGGPIADAELADFHVVLAVSYQDQDLGGMAFELWPDASPRAVRRFLRHCAEGSYDGTLFHRVMREFVVQGGDPTGTGAGASPYGQLTAEASIDPAHRHGYGVLSMTDPPSLQFFVCASEGPRVWALDEQPLSRLGVIFVYLQYRAVALLRLGNVTGLLRRISEGEVGLAQPRPCLDVLFVQFQHSLIS